jgi:hypothetical protein
MAISRLFTANLYIDFVVLIFGVAVAENEGVVKAQNSCAVILAPRRVQSQLEDRSSETLAVNQLSAGGQLFRF